MKNVLSLLLFVSVISVNVFAQGMPDPKVPQGENIHVPEGWEVRLDKPDSEAVIGKDPETADIFFVNMTPGWHIKTGPRAIFWHPELKADSDYTIQVEFNLFDTEGRDREGYGIFFGGDHLKGKEQEYLYFLIRNTGDFLIKSRKGSETKEIKGWTQSDAIVRYTDEAVASVLNRLSVSVEGSKASFFINGTEVISMNKDQMHTDGLFGLRVNHAVNLHISDLSLSKE